MSGDDQEKIIEGLTQYFEAEPNLELTLSSDMWDEATHKMRVCNRVIDQSDKAADTTLAHVKVPVNVRSPLLQLADVPGEVLDDNARGCDTSHKADVTDRSPPQQLADLPADVLGDNARGGDESHKPDVTDRSPLLLRADVPAEVLDDNARLGDTSHTADVTDRSPLLQLADVPAEVLNDNAPAVEEDTGRLSFAVNALLQVQKRTNMLLQKGTSSKRPARPSNEMRATRAGKKSSVSLMADRHLLQWKLKNRVRPYTFEIFMPPQKVASTSARCLWAARQGHPVRKGMLKMKAAMHRACHVAGGISMDVDQCDFASGNDLYGAAVSSVSEPWIARDQILCFSHQNNHSIVDAITSVIGLDTLSKLQTASSYFKMGYHLDRCASAALGYVSAPG